MNSHPIFIFSVLPLIIIYMLTREHILFMSCIQINLLFGERKYNLSHTSVKLSVQGYRIGYNGYHYLCLSQSVNLTQNPEIISHYFSQEASLARMMVLYTNSSF